MSLCRCASRCGIGLRLQRHFICDERKTRFSTIAFSASHTGSDVMTDASKNTSAFIIKKSSLPSLLFRAAQNTCCSSQHNPYFPFRSPAGIVDALPVQKDIRLIPRNDRDICHALYAQMYSCVKKEGVAFASPPFLIQNQIAFSHSRAFAPRLRQRKRNA